MKLLAQITNPVLPPSIGSGDNSVGGTAVGSIVSGTMGVMFIASFAMAFAYLVFGGVQWITSGGDKASLEAARNKIIHALVGLVIVASTWAVITLVAEFFGLKFEKLPIPTIGETTKTINYPGPGSGTGKNYQ